MENLRQILEENKVILKGHFLLASGLHSDTYFEKYRLLEKPYLIGEIIKTKENAIRSLGITLCIGPLTGGALVAFAVGRMLKVKAFYMEKAGEDLLLKRDFLIGKDDRILLCDDVMTTGGSFKKMIKCLGPDAKKIHGFFVLIDRSVASCEEIVPLISIYKTYAATYEPENCPLCKQGVPLEKRGSSPTPRL